ncbi:ribosome biogenesis GTPase Der [Ahrensia marina]|uniref:GTPase Der n=1 Tax=Ahrensia marina TaxID=1514904 RepID=A0A0M9GMI7_9HYPH|nr:ribosome biogenesis GTPase Der [Ahrensia marina]KPB01253.1 GTP-binding protein Der [Ahrensia marina]
MSFAVAIVGRPNVGKSTLFNRLVGHKIAIVDDQPGVTRDRRRHDARLFDLEFEVIDTAGLEEGAAETLSGRMRTQTLTAVEEADMVLFLVDAKWGLTADDKTFADILRRADKPVVLVANKSESKDSDAGYYEAFRLGLGEPVPISAEHGEGMTDLRQAIVEAVGEDVAYAEGGKTFEARVNVTVHDDEFEDDDHEPEYDDSKPMQIAIVGRPNAGKSTLINQMVQEERLLTGPEAGITRDSISVDWEWQGRKIRLFDTAGMRRKARVQEKLEKMSVGDGLRAIRFAEVVIIVFDATISFEKQDLQIVDLIAREGRAPVIAFNKWDLIENRQEVLADLREKTTRLLPQIRGIRAVPISGQTGAGLDTLMKEVIATHKVWNKRISTAKLNRWLEMVTAHHPPPAVRGRRLKLKYMTQAKTRPPGFVISCTRPDAVPDSYQRYMVNALREDFDMPGVPIRMMLRGGDNPFAHKAKRKN